MSQGYLQRVGHSKCIRCPFETSDEMSFAQQDEAMERHLGVAHPGWDFADVSFNESVPAKHVVKDQIVVKGKAECGWGDKAAHALELFDYYSTQNLSVSFREWLECVVKMKW